VQDAANLAGRDKERRILVAVDESEHSKRAVMYLADFFGDYPDVHLKLLAIVPWPAEDYFATDEERERWGQEKIATLERKLDEYKEMLVEAGFAESRVDKLLSVSKHASIADAILEEQERLRCCIVAVGRRGIDRHEEFIHGSTSNRILHHAKNCAVMIIE